MDAFLTWLKESKTVADIITGLYSSGIFLIVLSLLKPRLKICDRIAFQLDKNAPEGQKLQYSIKVSNKSIFFRIYDIQIRAWTSKIESSTNADDISYQQIKLRKEYQWVLNRLYIGHLFQDVFLKDKRLTSRTDYAVQFLTYDDLRAKIRNGNFITIEIIAKHSLTGFTRVLSKRYKHVDDIIKGPYYSGNSCKIKS
jgi:hypothetical protein